jgi:hypothetical protein
MSDNVNYKSSHTLAAADLVGFRSNATGVDFALTATSVSDSLAHKVTIRNDSATDHSAKTAILTGTDANGNVLTETLNLPGTSATVTSTKDFKTLTTVVPSATIGADTMDIGYIAAGYGPWVRVSYNQPHFGASVAANIGGTVNYDIEHTYDTSLSITDAAFKHASITAATADAYNGYVTPVYAVRLNVNSHTSGTAVFYVKA